jgi:hypothetical protein
MLPHPVSSPHAACRSERLGEPPDDDRAGITGSDQSGTDSA